MAGKLYLIPTVLSDDALHVIPAYVHEITKTLNHFFVEDERTARRYLRKSGFTRPFEEVELHVLNKETTPEEISNFGIYLTTFNCGLMSEAGVPAVADPGHSLVMHAHELNVRVIPMVGPSSILLALMASGMNGQQFCFHGYLPLKQPDRIKKILYLEQRAKGGETQLFIETPYRNNALITDILQHCHPSTLFCIASNLTGENESIKTKTIAEWRKNKPILEKVPAIFLIGNFTT